MNILNKNLIYFKNSRNFFKRILVGNFVTENKTFSKENYSLSLKPTDDFKSIIEKSEVPVLVDFYAEWCPPCKKLTPILEETLMKNKNFILLKVNVDDNGDLAQSHGVTGIPHLVLFKKGKKVNELVGLDESLINKMLNGL